jgi:hypothetical protein
LEIKLVTPYDFERRIKMAAINPYLNFGGNCEEAVFIKLKQHQ